MKYDAYDFFDEENNYDEDIELDNLIEGAVSDQVFINNLIENDCLLNNILDEDDDLDEGLLINTKTKGIKSINKKKKNKRSNMTELDEIDEELNEMYTSLYNHSTNIYNEKLGLKGKTKKELEEMINDQRFKNKVQKQLDRGYIPLPNGKPIDTNFLTELKTSFLSAIKLINYVPPIGGVHSVTQVVSQKSSEITIAGRRYVCYYSNLTKNYYYVALILCKEDDPTVQKVITLYNSIGIAL